MFNILITLSSIQSLISFLVVLVILGVITFVVLKLLEISCNRWLKIYISSMYGDDCSEWKLNNIIENILPSEDGDGIYIEGNDITNIINLKIDNLASFLFIEKEKNGGNEDE